MLTLVLAIVFTVADNQTVFAAIPTDNDLEQAITQAAYMKPGTKLQVQRDSKDQRGLIVSTFRHQDSNDNDCKIDAVLIGKTVLDLSGGDLDKVTVYFYSWNMNNYKVVTVRDIDVKAYAGGSVSKDEMLKGLDLKSGQAEKAEFLRDKITPPADINASVSGDDLQITCASIDGADSAQAKISAMSVAQAALRTMPEGVHKITIIFADSSQKGAKKSIIFSLEAIKSLSDKMDEIMAPVAFSEASTTGPEKTNASSSNH